MRAISGRKLLLLIPSVVVSALLTSCGGGGGGGGRASRPINGDTQALHAMANGGDAVFNAAGDGLAVWATESGSMFGWSKVLCSRYSASEKRWSAEMELSSFGHYPCVAASATDFMVAWVAYDPGRIFAGGNAEGIRARSYDGRNWGPEVELVSRVNIITSEDSPLDIVSDGSGHALIWIQDSTGTDDLCASTYAAGSWSALQVLDSGSSDVRYPALASSGAGSYAVAWRQSDGVAASVHAGVYSGGRWTQALLEVAPNDTGSPRIAASNLGYAVVWDQFDGASNNIYANIYSGSSWQDPILGLTPLETGTGNASGPRIASNGVGYAVVWHQRDGTSFDNVLANVFNGLIWNGEQYLETADGNADSLRIASNGSGYAAVWIQDDGESSPYASVYSSGAWSASAAPLRSAGGDAQDPALCRSGTSYAAVWAQSETTTTSIHGAVHGGSSWGGAAVLEHSGNPALSGTVLPRGAAGCSAVWVQWDGERYNLFASQYENNRWSEESAIVRGSHRAACEQPRLAASAAGTIVAVWPQFRPHPADPSAWAAFANVYRRGKWGTPLFIAEASIDLPDVATDGTSFMVAWSQKDGSGDSNIHARVFDGTAWGGTMDLDSTPGAARDPRVASSGSSYAVVWRQYESGTAWSAYASVYQGGIWSPPGAIESSTHPVYDVAIASDGTGYAAAWRQSDGAVDRVFANNYSGGWIPAAATALATTGGGSNDPQIASGGSGYAVAWVQEDGAGHENIYANIYTPAEGAWNPANTLLVDALDGDAELPSIAANGTGYAIAWSQEDGSAKGIHASTYDAAWGPPVNLDATAADALYPRIASDGTSWAVVWFTFDGTSAHTYHARFQGGAWSLETPLGDLYQNTVFPDVAAIPGGGYGAAYMQRDEADPTVWDIFSEIGF